MTWQYDVQYDVMCMKIILTNSSSWYSFSFSKIINYGDEIKIKTWLQHLVNQGRAKQNSLHSL